VRVKTRPLEGDAAVWDPADPEPFTALAGAQFLGSEGDTALIRTRGGCVMHAHPGWLAIRLDGGEDVQFSSAENCTWGTA